MSKNKTAVYLIFGMFVMMAIVFGGKSYNGLNKMDEEINKSWAQVEDVYQHKMDLIPNLVNTVKGYAAQEQEILTAVVEASAKASAVDIDAETMTQESLQQFQATQQGLSGALSKLMMVVDKYPDLKANQSFLKLQSQLEETENRIATERRGFNQTVGNLNSTIRIFPYNLVANMAGLEAKPYFESDKEVSKASDVDFE